MEPCLIYVYNFAIHIPFNNIKDFETDIMNRSYQDLPLRSGFILGLMKETPIVWSLCEHVVSSFPLGSTLFCLYIVVFCVACSSCLSSAVNFYIVFCVVCGLCSSAAVCFYVVFCVAHGSV